MNQPPLDDPLAPNVAHLGAAHPELSTPQPSDIPLSGSRMSIPQRSWWVFKQLTRIVVYVPLSLLVLLALLLGTEIGARLSVGLANRFVPDLELVYRAGVLNRDLTLAHATWSMPGIKVALDDLHFAWQPACLLQSRLCINELAATKVNVIIDTEQLSTGEDPASSNANQMNEIPDEVATELVLPLGIVLDSTQLQNLNVTVDDMQFAAQRIDGRASWFEQGLTVHQLSSQGLSVLQPLASNQPTSPTPAGITTDDQTITNSPATADTSALRASQAVNGSQANPGLNTAASTPAPSETWPLAELPTVFMPFPVIVHNLELQDSRLQLGQRQDNFSYAQLQGSFRQSQLNITKLALTHTDGQLDIIGQLKFEQDYPLDLDIALQLNQLPEIPELTNLALALTLSDSLGQLKLKASAKGDANVELAGIFTLKDPTLPYQLNLTATRLQWPLQHPEYTARDLTIESVGDLKMQSAKMSANLSSPFHQPLRLTADIAHQDATLTLKQFQATGPLGTVDIQGELDYADKLTWQAKVLLDEFKLEEIILPADTQTTAASAATTPQTHNSLPKSNISGTLQTDGHWHEQHWQIAVFNTELKGLVQDYPFDIKGDISIDDALFLRSKNLNATVLGAQLSLKGEANANWNIQGELQVPDFGLWLPKASGGLQANIAVTGDAKQPQLELNAQLTDLLYQNIKLKASNLKAYYQPLTQHEFAISLESTDLQVANNGFDTVDFNSKGNLNAQTLTVHASGDLGLDLALASQYDPKKSQLQTQINRLDMATPVGLWQLDQDVTISWDQLKNRGNLTPFCLVNPNSRLCLTQSTLQGTKGEVQLSYSGNPGKLLTPLLPANMQWDGSADMTSRFSWAANRQPTADLALHFPPGSLVLKRSQNHEVTLKYQDLSLEATLDAKQLRTVLNVESEDIANWQSELSVNVSPDRALSGYAHIHRINLQPLGQFFPQLHTLEGILSSKLNFAGTLAEPEVAGNISLTEGALALTANPTLINKMDLAVNLGGQQADLKGRWMMGNGLGRLTGEMRWPKGQFSGELAIKGDKLAMIQPPLALLDISPDLHIGFSHTQLEVKGVVDIPSGNIKIVQLAEGGVALSEDVVFDDSIAALQPKASPYAIVADLNINVGNDLIIDGMGLKGKLQGTVKLQQQAFRPPMLFGDIKVKQGNYKFMGQTLNIRTGEVQFVGPIAVPNLNIEAVREIKAEDLVAGVRVTGTPNRPVVTLFSNPAKEQAEILSYIVKGSGFNNTNNEQNNSLMMGAALGLSSQLSGGAINSIGSTATGLIEEFGFSNVQLDTNDEGRVAISGFIGDRLMVKYGVGVFNPGYEMTVRYYLLSQLYLETVSGTLGQSLDLYYNFNIK
ncbi:MAG: autotransporter assembly complex protein TamB [Shewanella sp.]